MTPAREQQLLAENARQRADIERLSLENQLLRDKINLMLARLFDKSSESIDPSQLELFGSDATKKATAAAPADPGPAAETPAQDTAAAKERAPRKPRDLSHLPVEETVLTSDEVAANPGAYRLIERIVTDRLDYQPGRILIQRTVREVHVAKDDPDAAPVKPAAPPSLGLAATPRFAAYVTASKYCHHRPPAPPNAHPLSAYVFNCRTGSLEVVAPVHFVGNELEIGRVLQGQETLESTQYQ
jgi:transposase